VIPYQLTILERPGYLHAKVEGERTPENALRFLGEAYQACLQHGRSALLLEVRFTGPSLEIPDIFQVISQASADGAKLRRIAYVDATTSDAGQASFAETVAVNRSVNVRLFADVSDAARWLEAP
jgi:hypothetical protein